MYFQAPKPLKCHCHLGTQSAKKFNERKKSNQHFKLAHGFFHCQKLKPISKMNWNQLHHWFWHFPYQFCTITIFTRMPQHMDDMITPSSSPTFIIQNNLYSVRKSANNWDWPHSTLWLEAPSFLSKIFVLLVRIIFIDWQTCLNKQSVYETIDLHWRLQ